MSKDMTTELSELKERLAAAEESNARLASQVERLLPVIHERDALKAKLAEAERERVKALDAENTAKRWENCAEGLLRAVKEMKTEFDSAWTATKAGLGTPMAGTGLLTKAVVAWVGRAESAEAEIARLKAEGEAMRKAGGPCKRCGGSGVLGGRPDFEGDKEAVTMSECPECRPPAGSPGKAPAAPERKE